MTLTLFIETNCESIVLLATERNCGVVERYLRKTLVVISTEADSIFRFIKHKIRHTFPRRYSITNIIISLDISMTTQQMHQRTIPQLLNFSYFSSQTNWFKQSTNKRTEKTNLVGFQLRAKRAGEAGKCK